jgi:two-component system, cell cycle sensor histidine kinase and response regulator CckA
MPNTLMDQAQFKRTLSRAIAWPLLVMAALVGIAVWQVGSLLAATHRIDHTNQVIALARLTQKQITDMQAGLRSYHLTHDLQFLQRYTLAHATFDTDQKGLERLTVDNPPQQQRLAQIRADYARWFAVLHQGKALPSRDYIALSRPRMDALSKDFTEFIAAEESLRQVRTQAAQQGAGRALVISLSLALLLGLFLAFINRRQLLSLSGSYECSFALVRSQAEALRASEEQLAITLRSIGDGVIATDAQGHINFLNPVAERLTGWTQAEAQGKDLPEVFAIVNEATRQTVESPVEKVLREGRVVGLVNHTLLIARDGTETPIADTGAPIRDAQGDLRGSVLVFHDVSERKRLELQLLQAQKMESVGRLAGGIAHDFNNLLTAILGYTELAELDSSAGSAVQSHLHNIHQAGERAADLTRQLLTFARRQVIEPRVLNLNELATSLEAMLRRLLGENIELVFVLDTDLGAVEVDPGQFTQIVVNLALNARDAMPQGGKITIETSNATLDEAYARQHSDVVPGEYVLLAVSDTGVGMEEGIRLHIFEPFFTTKEKGRGTGLGLATVYGIVKQAGGHIWLYSEPGEGATFKIYLPRTNQPLERQEAPQPRAILPPGKETVLLVEDEPAVRALALEVLSARGYRVLEADNGVVGLQKAQAYPGEIALLITDVVMPQMSGNELADRLQTVRPDMKVLYMSGYTENTIVHHGVLEAGVVFLSKPFTPTSLTRKVRDLLDQP